MRLEMLKLARLWDHKPGVARWWERLKARPSYQTAIINWLRPQDYARYGEDERSVERCEQQPGAGSRRHALIGTRVGGS
ncbi:MAG: hypothetical protein ACREQO_04920 [Candidatus Binatia bacterium]